MHGLSPFFASRCGMLEELVSCFDLVLCHLNTTAILVPPSGVSRLAARAKWIATGAVGSGRAQRFRRCPGNCCMEFLLSQCHHPHGYDYTRYLHSPTAELSDDIIDARVWLSREYSSYQPWQVHFASGNKPRSRGNLLFQRWAHDVHCRASNRFGA